MLQNASGFIGAFALSASLVLLLERAAPRLGLMDAPAGRKAHERPTPLVGGLAIFAAVAAVWALVGAPPRHFATLEAGLAAIVAVGLADDALDLRPRTKLVALAAAASLMTLPGLVFASLVGEFGGAPVALGPLALPFTLVMIVGVANAYNMLDGIDGAAGGAALAAFAALAAAATIAGRADLVALLAPLCAATLGFLAFNLRHPWRGRARVFLGDAGSLMLGAAIAWMIAALAAPDRLTGAAAWPLASLLWIVCVPAIDTLSLIVRRIAAGRSPMAADREHLHHLLLEAGLTHGRAAAAIIALCALCGAIGVGGAAIGVPDAVLAAGLGLPLALHAAFVRMIALRRTDKPRVPAAGGRGLAARPDFPKRGDVAAGPEL